jgi:fumarate reductase (CoM/CoB) subunit B
MMGNSEIRVRLFRYDPGSGEAPRYDTFSVGRKPEMRVLDVLNHIYDLDENGAIAYRWYCGTKKCGACGITVNGAAMLACWEPAADEMTLEPLANFPIIRDLVVDTEPYEKLLIKLRPTLHREHPPVFPEKIEHSRMLGAQRLLKCIECNVCTATVPVKRVGPAGIDWNGYAGPAALVRFARFVLDPRDELDRKPLALSAGLKEFPLYDALRKICPQGIDIVEDALVPAQERLFGASSGAPEVVGTAAPLIIAKSWSAFVRLTHESKEQLLKNGAIKGFGLPGITEAYRLSEN